LCPTVFLLAYLQRVTNELGLWLLGLVQNLIYTIVLISGVTWYPRPMNLRRHFPDEQRKLENLRFQQRENAQMIEKYRERAALTPDVPGGRNLDPTPILRLAEGARQRLPLLESTGNRIQGLIAETLSDALIFSRSLERQTSRLARDLETVSFKPLRDCTESPLEQYPQQSPNSPNTSI
jgi:hypothetical protein